MHTFIFQFLNNMLLFRICKKMSLYLVNIYAGQCNKKYIWQPISVSNTDTEL